MATGRQWHTDSDTVCSNNGGNGSDIDFTTGSNNTSTTGKRSSSINGNDVAGGGPSDFRRQARESNTEWQ
jgi:hypothetical protein